MNNIKFERDRFEKEIEDNKIRLNDSNNQCQVKCPFDKYLYLRLYFLISRILKSLYMNRKNI
jgi:hypothetical protein